MLLDSATLYYRAFFALPEKMTAPDGQPHNAVRGFFSMMSKLRDQHEPSGLVAAWDTDWRPQWRVDLIPSYKTHRIDMETELTSPTSEVIPDTLGPQIEAIGEILDACGIARVGLPHYEADDVIASFAHQNQGPNLVVSSDKDLIQVISASTSLLLQVNGGIENWPVLGPAEVQEKFGVPVESYLDFAVLRGDPSDGLPGVRGIGIKTASALVREYGVVDKIFEAIESGDIKPPLTRKLAENITANVEYINLAKKVITAETDLPLKNIDYQIPAKPHHPRKLNQLTSDWGVARFVDQIFS